MRNGSQVTELKTGRKGIFLGKNKRNLSIDLWIVQWEGDTHQSKISPSLLLEGQWNYSPVTKQLLKVGI